MYSEDLSLLIRSYSPQLCRAPFVEITVRGSVDKSFIVSSLFPNRKKKKKLSHQVSIYNPNGTSFLPGQNGFPETREDNDEHEYASIEDTLVYTHLLRKGKEIGVYGDFDTYQPFTGRMDSQKPLVSKDSIADDRQASKQPFAISSQQAPPLPIRPLSHDQQLVDNVIYQAEGQSEEERSPSLGPRLEPEGGNWGEDWIRLFQLFTWPTWTLRYSFPGICVITWCSAFARTFFFFPQERDFAPKPWTEKHCVQTRLQLLPYFLSDEGCI